MKYVKIISSNFSLVSFMKMVICLKIIIQVCILTILKKFIQWNLGHVGIKIK